SNGCASSATQFTDASTITNGDSISNWLWAFGDGSPVNAIQSPIHTYNNAGLYNTSLVAISIHGCADTVTKPINIYPNSTIQFYADDTAGCQNACTYFSTSSSISSGSIVQWMWNFGDGTTANTQNAVHCYPQTGL